MEGALLRDAVIISVPRPHSKLGSQCDGRPLNEQAVLGEYSGPRVGTTFFHRLLTTVNNLELF